MKHVIAAIALAGITGATAAAQAEPSEICRPELRDGDTTTVCYTTEAFEQLQREALEHIRQREERIRGEKCAFRSPSPAGMLTLTCQSSMPRDIN